MNKRNFILATVTTALIGSGIAYAGSKGYRSGHGHMKHGVEQVVHHLDWHLKLTDSQESELQEILDNNRDIFLGARDFKQTMARQMMNLDPDSPSYQSEVAALAEQLAEEVKQKTMQAADLVHQISAILSAEQKTEARRMIQERMRRHAGHMQG